MSGIVSAILAMFIKVLEVLVKGNKDFFVRDLILQLKELKESDNKPGAGVHGALMALVPNLEEVTNCRLELLPVKVVIEREDQADALIDRLIKEDGPIEKGGTLGLLLEWVSGGRRLLRRKLFPLLGHPYGEGVIYTVDEEKIEDLVKDFKSILSVGYEAGRADGRESEIESAVRKRIDEIDLAQLRWLKDKAERLRDISREAYGRLEENDELKRENKVLNAENNRLMNVISLHGEAERKEAKQRRVEEIEERKSD